MAATPSLDRLRELARAQGVEPTDQDLAAASEFLDVLLPAFRKLEELVPADAVPAAVFLPERE
jgi:hypothetical protein